MKEFEQADPETPAAADLIGKKIAKLGTEIVALEQRERGLTRPNPLSTLIETGPGAAARWEATPVAGQRAIAAVLFASDGPLGQPRIRRVADSASPAVQDRIHWVTSV